MKFWIYEKKFKFFNSHQCVVSYILNYSYDRNVTFYEPYFIEFDMKWGIVRVWLWGVDNRVPAPIHL